MMDWERVQSRLRLLTRVSAILGETPTAPIPQPIPPDGAPRPNEDLPSPGPQTPPPTPEPDLNEPAVQPPDLTPRRNPTPTD